MYSMPSGPPDALELIGHGAAGQDEAGTIPSLSSDESVDSVTPGGRPAPLRARTASSRPGRATGGASRGGLVGTIARMAVTDDKPVADQLAELGAQLAWVRDYL